MKINPILKTLKKERKKQQKSVRVMSEKIGVSKSMYSYLENGDKRLTYETAVRIADELGLSTDELFLGDYDEFYKGTLI